MQQTARANAKGMAAIRRMKDVLHLQERIEANTPSFGKFLGLCVSPSETGCCSVRPSSDENTLIFRYKFPPNDRLKYLVESNENNTILRSGPSLSTYTSILDEITTQSLIAAAKNHPRPGVSVTLQTKWGPAAHTENLKEVDIVSTVTKKGRTLGFVRAEVRNPLDNGLICYFDHVKYLPTTWVIGLLVSPIGMWLLDFFYKYLAPYFRKKSTKTADENYEGILDTFEYASDTSATFRYNQQHANGVGGLHGGIQSILMERLGKHVAQNEFTKLGSNVEVECESLQVSYQSSASKVIELRAHVIDPPKDDSVTLRIETLRTSTKPNAKRRVVSEGILTFVKASSKKDQ